MSQLRTYSKKYIDPDYMLRLGAASKIKSGTFGKWGGVLLLLPFDAEAFKTCKNTIKLICVLYPVLGWVLS